MQAIYEKKKGSLPGVAEIAFSSSTAHIPKCIHNYFGVYNLPHAISSGYAIQPSSDIIYEEPQSRTVLAGSSASFICNTSSIAPATGYSLPNIAWRVNGNTTLPGSNWKIIPHTNMASSELLVRSAEPTDASYIECLVEDGELNSNYLLVTSSRRASLTVVGK